MKGLGRLESSNKSVDDLGMMPTGAATVLKDFNVEGVGGGDLSGQSSSHGIHFFIRIMNILLILQEMLVPLECWFLLWGKEMCIFLECWVL
jgi:hypothetical protein